MKGQNKQGIVTAGFEYCRNSLYIENFQHFVEVEKSANPYNTSFNIFIVSGLFSGCADFECDYNRFLKFIEHMKKMYSYKTFEAKLEDICYGSSIVFKMNQCGHITISGQIFGYAMEHSLTFVFGADQTILLDFINQLKQL